MREMSCGQRLELVRFMMEKKWAWSLTQPAVTDRAAGKFFTLHNAILAGDRSRLNYVKVLNKYFASILEGPFNGLKSTTFGNSARWRSRKVAAVC